MNTKDMTTGHALKQILIFAIPLFIGNIFQQIYNIVDTMVAGYTLGDGAIAAIGVTGTLYGLLINFAWGMNSGFGIIVAQNFGAKDQDNLKRSIAAMLVLDVVITTLLSVASLVFLRPMLSMIHIPDAVFDDAYSYIFIILAGMVTTILYNMCAGILRAVGNSKAPLYFLIFSSILNLSLDFLFIVILGMGVSGAALATVIAEAVSAVLSGLLIITRYKAILPSREHFHFSGEFLWSMLSTGGAMAFMLCVVDLGSVIYQSAINELGETLIVAHTAARKIISIFMMPLSSLASANSTFISQNWGAKQYGRVSQTLKKVLLLEVAWGLFSCAMVYLFGGAMIRYLTNTANPEVLENAVLSIRIHFVFYPVLGMLLAFRTALQSMGKKIVPVISSSFELGLKILAGLILIPLFGYLWVCLTEPIIWTVCFVFLIINFLLATPEELKTNTHHTLQNKAASPM